MHPFRFGVQAASAPDGPSWRALARRCEDLGYSTLYVPDHLGDQWGPLVALTVAAEATRTLRVGPLVLANDYRHPVVLAKELATLDLVCEGRLDVGIGAGWLRSDYERSGIPYDPPATRVERLREAVGILRALLVEGKATFEGAHYRVRDAEGRPRPRSEPGPRLVIGGGSPKVLALAAELADVVGLNPSLREGEVGPATVRSATAEHYRRRVAWVREAAGARFATLELQVLTFVVQVAKDRRAVLERLAPAFGLDPDEAAEIPLVLVGSTAELCETLERRREELGVSFWVVHDTAMEAFAPVVERLAGR